MFIWLCTKYKQFTTKNSHETANKRNVTFYLFSYKYANSEGWFYALLVVEGLEGMIVVYHWLVAFWKLAKVLSLNKKQWKMLYNCCKRTQLLDNLRLIYVSFIVLKNSLLSLWKIYVIINFSFFLFLLAKQKRTKKLKYFNFYAWKIYDPFIQKENSKKHFSHFPFFRFFFFFSIKLMIIFWILFSCCFPCN
jgi:hypothetical protein